VCLWGTKWRQVSEVAQIASLATLFNSRLRKVIIALIPGPGYQACQASDPKPISSRTCLFIVNMEQVITPWAMIPVFIPTHAWKTNVCEYNAYRDVGNFTSWSEVEFILDRWATSDCYLTTVRFLGAFYWVGKSMLVTIGQKTIDCRSSAIEYKLRAVVPLVRCWIDLLFPAVYNMRCQAPGSSIHC
jgi:hypothetical protein